MPNKMLIDASHREETRVVVTRGNRIEEFDFESQDKKQIKGNIYLARVTRVEPSLQAAFVEYGGNRHGFLAFSEIHPDYYQIPIADRQALLKADAEAAEAEEEEDEEEREERGKSRKRRRGGRNRPRRDQEASGTADDGDDAPSEDGEAVAAESADTDDASQDDAGQDEEQGDAAETVARSDGEDGETTPGAGGVMSAAIESDVISERIVADDADSAGERGRREVEDVDGPSSDDEDGEVESVGAEDALEELPSRRKTVRKQYKIQEVIKRRQILLVQVVKEERGNKGAALTTYLSLAGRYSVLMPNTARGGGISRKITSASDRKRLKDVVQDLEVPQGMGVILRTAGANRTKAEIKRDYEYLMRLWENVRTLTLQSSAPALVYEEGSLIKRSVRDLYNKEIDEIQVAGEDGYREAKDFMRMLMPSHAKVVQPYRDVVPIFARNGIEAQLDKMLQPQVTLKSGGYIIINQTEALVSIDVNSGRSTREHSIEDTALQTNLEAAEEVARQLRLRDLAGLIVIDFIDMEEKRNNRAVEKRIKDHLKNDRARIQVGRISHFGLLEMSRQRIRASVLESTMKPCPHCAGTGQIRSDSSTALHVVRAIEEFLLKDARSHITVRTPVNTALYVLNHKRSNIVDLEQRFGLSIMLEADETLGTQHYAITRGAAVERPVNIADLAPRPAPAYEEEDDVDMEIEVDADEEIVAEEAREARPQADGDAADDERGRKRKRRRKRRGRDRDAAPVDGETRDMAVRDEDGDDDTDADADSDTEEGAETPAVETASDEEGDRKKRRRGRRGGKRNRRDDDAETTNGAQAGAVEDGEGDAETGEPDAVAAEAEAMPVVDESPIAPADADAEAVAVAPVETETVEAEAVEEAVEPAPKKRARRAPRKKAAEVVDATAAEPAGEPVPVAAEAIVAEAARSEPVAPEAEAQPAAAEEIAIAEEPRARTPAPEPSEPVVTSSGAAAEDAKPRKAGWWQRKSFF
jgi:ribonuclease E